MLKSIEKALRLSEIREALNGLNAIAEPTDAQQTEERNLLRVTKKDGDGIPRGVDRGGRRTRDRSGRRGRTRAPTARRARERRPHHESVCRASVDRRGRSGAAQPGIAEATNQIPLDMLRLPVEHRAVTTGPTNVGTTEQPAIMPVFAAGVGAFIFADRPRVDAGTVAYPVLDQRPTVGGPHTDSASVDETTGSFSSDLLLPGRIQASYFYRRVDAARFPVIDMALRQALNGSLEEKLDQELIAGTDGLLTGNNLANHAASAVTAFATFLSEFGHGRVDGRFAASLTDVRTVAGAHTYAHMGNQYRSTTADYSALDALDRKTGGVRVSAHVPAVASHKQNALIRMGQHDRAVVQVLWDGVTLVPDELTKVKTGEVAITAILLVATKILRSASFYKQETQHA